MYTPSKNVLGFFLWSLTAIHLEVLSVKKTLRDSVLRSLRPQWPKVQAKSSHFLSDFLLLSQSGKGQAYGVATRY